MVLNLEGGYEIIWGFPDDSVVESPPAVQKTQEAWVLTMLERFSGGVKWQPIPVFLPRKKSHKQRSLVAYSL